MSKKTVIGTAVAAGLVGWVLGLGTTVETPVKEVKAVKVKQELPIACKTALEQADKSISISGKVFEASSDSMQAIMESDIAGVDKANDRMADLSPKYDKALNYYTIAKAVCLK